MKKLFLSLIFLVSSFSNAFASYDDGFYFAEPFYPIRMEKNGSLFISTKFGPFADATAAGQSMKTKKFFNIEIGKMFDYSKNFKTAFSLEVLHYSYENNKTGNFDSNGAFWYDMKSFTEIDLAFNWYMYYSKISPRFMPYFGLGIIMSPSSKLVYADNPRSPSNYIYPDDPLIMPYQKSDYYTYEDKMNGEFGFQLKLGFQYYIFKNLAAGLEYTVNTNTHYFNRDSHDIKVENNLNALQLNIKYEY